MKTCFKKIAALRAEYVNISVFMFSVQYSFSIRASDISPSPKNTTTLKICKFQDFPTQCY